MAKQGFAHVAIRVALRVAGHGQAQQAQRVKRMGGRQIKPHTLGLRQPLGLAVNPFALHRNLGGAHLLLGLEQPAQKHRLVAHAVAQAL